MSDNAGVFQRLLVLLYGTIAYVTFLAAFLYLIGFSHDFFGYTHEAFVAPSVSSGNSDSTSLAIVINVMLMALFGIQHSIMPRKGFKEAITKAIPTAAERPTYVLATNIVLFVLYFNWQPLNSVVWSTTNEVAVTALWAFCALGWGLALLATFLLDHFELFGLKQIWCYFRQKPIPAAQFRQPLLYRLVRHPLQMGIFIGIWVTPHMTLGHLVFNIGMSVYIFVGLFYEEKDLIREFGASYEEYKRKVPQLLPYFPKSK